MIVERPVTIEDISKDLRNLGVKPGMTLLVHSSLKSLGGWVVGGVEAVIMALEEVLGDEGTLVMPTQSPNLTDPSIWRNPSADSKWWQLIRDFMPPYDKDFTLTTGMGQIPETFRKQAGVVRSAHPHVSFAAKGKHAKVITQSHPLSDSLGQTSPLAKMYELGAYVLLLGVTYESNTSFHLAEYRGNWKGKRKRTVYAPVRREGGKTIWEEYSDINYDSGDFGKVGADFERECPEAYTRGNVQNSSCIIAQQRAMVNYAVKWLEANRGL
ncbi:aminoglycoside N(3)-acetyltransferase [Paenibacillus faecalis]|uniref:aminoglycoside N(3)-acetyltransferase n=1 Tax=Paenibacillus faecalis TaxID=2079532 RepID=UPI000D0EDA53|nr:AAC(3) family N-acetyltransferase [Paenibacillus faecalis]